MTTTPVSVEAIESSVAKLIRNWKRRMRWRLLFDSRAGAGDIGDAAPTWRTSLVQFLESTPVHIATILLLVSDVVLTILELSSSFHANKCNTTTTQRRAEDLWYHWLGISILCLLLVKSLGLALGLGAAFFTRPGYVVDGSVLIGAIFMETFLEGKGGGLLVVVSLWRVLRLVESAFELSDDAIEAQIKEIMLQLESLRSGDQQVNSNVGHTNIPINVDQDA